ncbi:MAG: YceI family protein [Polyangiaceae bacterium]
MADRPLLRGSVEVHTFKEGLLSRVAHDLHIDARDCEVRADESGVNARFPVANLAVLHAVRDGRPDPDALSAKDRAQIEENIRDKVLHADRHPTAAFDAKVEPRDGGYRLAGTLELHGKSQPLSIDVSQADGKLRGEVELTPSHWGIAPFKAMLGAIKLQDRVVVKFEFEAP